MCDGSQYRRSLIELDIMEKNSHENAELHHSIHFY